MNLYVCMSANHPYLQPQGWITKGAAQRDRPNAFERRLRLPPNGHEWPLQYQSHALAMGRREFRGAGSLPDVVLVGLLFLGIANSSLADLFPVNSFFWCISWMKGGRLLTWYWNWPLRAWDEVLFDGFSAVISRCKTQYIMNDPGAQQPSQMFLTWVKARPQHRKLRPYE